MVSIRTRELKKGGASHTVTWRDPQQGLKSRTFKDVDYAPGEAKAKAVELKDFLDSNGNSFKLAANEKTIKDSTAPTVYEVVVRHMDLLREPQPGTVAKYRRMAGGHIAPSDRGKTRVDKVTKAPVIDWLERFTILSRAKPTGQPLGRKDQAEHPCPAVRSVRDSHGPRAYVPESGQGSCGSGPKRGARACLCIAGGFGVAV